MGVDPAPALTVVVTTKTVVALAGQVPDVGIEPGPYVVVGGYSGDGWPGEPLNPDEPGDPLPKEPLDDPPAGTSGTGVAGQITTS